MQSAILYFTKWGATRQYAEWIANAVPGTDLVEANTVRISAISSVQCVTTISKCRK